VPEAGRVSEDYGMMGLKFLDLKIIIRENMGLFYNQIFQMHSKFIKRSFISASYESRPSSWH